jgi:hypothetical protein
LRVTEVVPRLGRGARQRTSFRKRRKVVPVVESSPVLCSPMMVLSLMPKGKFGVLSSVMAPCPICALNLVLRLGTGLDCLFWDIWRQRVVSSCCTNRFTIEVKHVRTLTPWGASLERF